MKSLTSYLLPLTSYILLLICVSCSDEEKFTTEAGARLAFSEDSVKFDTVFTTIGSSTEILMVYNHNGKGVRLTDVSLQSKGASGFRLNLDGQYGTSFSDIEIYGGDSIFCFVEVTVNPQDSDSPVVVNDEIVFTLENGTKQRVCLQAYGQDAIILRSPTYTENTTLSATRPYLIYGAMTVGENVTLTIDAGARLFFHADGYIDCNGTIRADGADGEITMRGDRLDKMFWYLPYDRLDNQWLGIKLNSSSQDNYFCNVDIHSGNYGIEATGENTDEMKLTLLNSQIHNVGGNGLTLNGCKALVGNSQISNCRGNCVEVNGGQYTFDFCTIAQFCPWIAARGHTLSFSNSGEDAAYVALEQLNMTNCIVTGYASDEVFGSPHTDAQDEAFNFQFKNCMLDTPEPTSYAECFIDCKYQTSEQKSTFRLIDTDNFIYDFRLTEGSMARGIGTADILDQYPKDRLGNERDAQSVDAGCYQFIEN